MIAAPTKERVIDALRQVMDPELGRSLVDLGMIRDARVEEGVVSLTLAVTTMACPLRAQLAAAARAAVAALPGVSEVQVDTVPMTEQERGRLLAGFSGPEPAHIQRVVAVASGKAGSGQSMVTALLASELARRGRRVGVLAADAAGPGFPRLFGLEGRSARPDHAPARSRLGVAVLSPGHLPPEEESAALWRGPLVARAIRRFWSDVRCWPLDDLLVDVPAGASDEALTVMESLPLNGLVLVTTPQDPAGRAARRTLHLAQRLGVRVLGVVENMSHFACPDSGRLHQPFGPGHGERIAAEARVQLLARLPIDPALARLAEEGRIEDYTSEDMAALARALVVELAVAATESEGAAAASWA